MSILPLEPRLKDYRGAKENLRRKADDENRVRKKVAAHLNRLIANNPEEIQQYLYGLIAAELQVTADQVRNAIGNGGSNGITLRVTERDREMLQRFKTS